MINVRNGTENDKQKLLNDYPNLHKFFGDNGYLIVAEKEKDIIGFLWAFVRDIPAPVESQEMFINAIEVINLDYVTGIREPQRIKKARKNLLLWIKLIKGVILCATKIFTTMKCFLMGINIFGKPMPITTISWNSLQWRN